MIVGLKFSNFKSYRDTAEFSFLALESNFNAESVTTVNLKDGSSVRLLNAAVIFGANASGKSNVIWALSALSNTVSRSLLYNVKSKPHFIWPYAFNKACLNKPTSIELDFIFQGVRYVYKIEGKKNFISKEILKEVRSGKNLVVFERNSKNEIRLGSGWNADKNMIADSSLLTNQLVLSWLATKDSAGLQDVANYIADLAIYFGADHSGSRSDRQLVMETIIKDDKSLIFRRLQTLMSIADLGVIGISVTRNKESDFKLPRSIDEDELSFIVRNNRWDIRLLHATNKVNEVCSLDFKAESEGTQALFSVGARLLEALETGSFVAYDEINDAIHPNLLRLMVNMFQSEYSNPKGAQLLFSTHDSSVADHNTLRADQVWFVEKKDSVSDLFSAQDFDDVNIEVPFESWYRSGRFGALPKLDDFKKVFRLQ